MSDDKLADQTEEEEWDYEPVERTPEERDELRAREPGNSRATFSKFVPKVSKEGGKLHIKTRK